MGIHLDVQDWLTAGRGVVAVWELLDDGIPRGVVDHATGQMREVHDGVFLSGHAPITPWQRWKAASLTTPDTLLADWSGSCLSNIRDEARDRWPTTVVRPGDGGIVRIPGRDGRIGSLVARRSRRRMVEDATVVDGIKTLNAGRTLLDLIPRVGEEKGERLTRDTLRRTKLEGIDLLAVVALNRGVRGVARLRKYVDMYGSLPGVGGTQSDAEVLAIGLLAAAGMKLPVLNQWIGGEEADLVDYDRRLIVELDGPQYHQFEGEDQRKEQIWSRLGFVVRRVPTGDVYDQPHLLIDAWGSPLTPEELERAGRRA